MGKKKKVLIVVAHPDDETIWMGGSILENDWDLTIISLCRKDDPDREPKFRKVCEILNAKCFISDLEDETMRDLPLDEAINRIEKFADKKYDWIFTHGENGEYGHKRHILTHQAVKEMLEKNLLKGKLFLFSYVQEGEFCYANSSADKFINLKSSSVLEKKKLIQNVYGFDKGSFEEVCCRDKEAFNLMRK